MLAVAVLPAFAPAAQAQNLDELFRKASPTVVVVRSKGRDVRASGVVRFTETGSGVLISDDGRVMTAAHVVNGMDEITVEGIGGEVVRAKLMSANTDADVSLLQLERVTRPCGWRGWRLCHHAGRRAGHGHRRPLRASYSLSVGWISARWAPNTIFRDMPLAEFFQTTATINTGNSGGPLFNMAGEVVGIVSQNISKSGGSEGLGFRRDDQQRAELLLVPRKVFWGALQGMLLTGRLATIFNVPAPAGFLVKTVAQGSTAWNMGLQGGDGTLTIGGKEIPVGGDIILSVDDIPVVSEDEHREDPQPIGRRGAGRPVQDERAPRRQGHRAHGHERLRRRLAVPGATPAP